MPALSLPSTLLIFAVQCLVLSGAGVAAQVWRRWLTGRGSSPLGALVLAALAPCALGYAAFIFNFIHPMLGRGFSWVAIAAVVGTLAHTWLRPREAGERPAIHGRLVLLTLLAGCFYISALFIYTKPKFTDTASHRFLPNMPGDSEIPRIFAERLFIGESPKAPGGDWLSSDRPPLQSGVALITLPALRAFNFGFDKACATAGVWFQLLWIPALWVFLRWLGLTERAAHAGTAALVFTGFLLFNSIFVWPKLAGASLVLLGFCVVFADENEISPARRGPLLGALAAAGSLAHGGVMFSLLALVPIAAFSLRSRWRLWGWAGVTFVVLSLPWITYQRLYEPPGNRLVKWHIAGTIPPDERGVLETLTTNYRTLGWDKALETRRENGRVITGGSWENLFAFRGRAVTEGKRTEEVMFTFRTAALWILGVAALPLLAWQFFRGSRERRKQAGRHGLAFAWLVLTLAIWLTLMFFPAGTLVHQGSYVVQLLLLGLLTAWALLAHRALFAALALAQIALFALTWLPPAPAFVGAEPTLFAMLATGVFGLAIAALGAESLLNPAQAEAWSRRLAELREWLRSPAARLTLPALAGFAALLFLRKPHALTTPQLWAEDGSIFLMQADLLGGQAFTTPYMGYLHTLPRLIAWLAPKALDPAWWPLFYNGTAFAIWLLVIARLFSPRLALPGKPWLALAFLFVPHSGEVMANITNLQWVTAFALLLHPLMAAPRSRTERFTDLGVLAVLALTGPFAIVFAPLFAWRWWRERDGDSLAALGVVAAGATLQAWFTIATGPRFEYQAQALHIWPNIEVLARRLIIWPVLGADLATSLPRLVVGAIGGGFIVVALAWALRPHRWQVARAQIVIALLLLALAAVYRSRPDTWDGDNLWFADRYFYIPRVLLAWLLIMEFDAAPRLVARIARTICLAIGLVHAGSFIVPAPPDYKWATHVDPIRRGVPGNLPILPEGWTLEYRGRPQGR